VITFKAYCEAMVGVDPKSEQEVIRRSFEEKVIADLLADASVTGDVIPSEDILSDLQSQVPSIDFERYININPSANRVVIHFNPEGQSAEIEVPSQLHRDLGPVIILHEIAHKLYSIDILTNEILNHPLAVNIFTLARTIEDVRIELEMEQRYPDTIDVFKNRAQYIMPIYKSHTPSEFGSIVDNLFLHLRGYMPSYKGDSDHARLAQQFIDAGNDRKAKVATIIKLAEIINNNDEQ